MKIRLLIATLTVSAAAPSAPRIAACTMCETTTTPAPATTTSAADTKIGAPTATLASHPLRGVVVDILPAKQALLVKHEAIPGVMKAMTMLFQVDPAVLATVAKGQRIEALLVETDDGWRLDQVKPVAKEG